MKFLSFQDDASLGNFLGLCFEILNERFVLFVLFESLGILYTFLDKPENHNIDYQFLTSPLLRSVMKSIQKY
jgi:hypothetical protein